MAINRSEFIKQSLLFSAGTAILSGSSIAALTGCTSSGDTPSTMNKPFGIQLWTVRDVIGDDVEGTLKLLAGYGYKMIETYDGEMGMFWGMGHKNYSAMLSDLGMTPVSGHCNFMDRAEEKIEQAAEIGMDYLIVPWLGAQASLDEYKKAAEQFNIWGEMCKNAGVQFAYHNHDYSFFPVDGVYPQDVMMEGTDPELVEFEMDLYWVVAAGQEPGDWMKKYPGRFTLAHVKDLQKTGEEGAHQSTILGTGSMDLAAMMKTGQEFGCKHMIVEQEQYEGTDPMTAAKAGADWMKKNLS